MEKVKGNFIWFGGAGAVHKGLDLVLEAFATMPEYTLTVYGKLGNEDDFTHAYDKELFHTPNIHMKGWVDPGSPEFAHATTHSLAIIYPSCSEGTAGSVVLAMHAGLIPIISRETGVDVEDFGIVLKENTIQEIQTMVRNLSLEPHTKLTQRAVAAWKYARAMHTRPHFEAAYRAVIKDIELARPQ
ncbi:MAG: glycosyltransferase [Patescibacteria group bacterium]